ncbi:MAG: type II toxin-antitoxin system RelE/ParE family toxin [Treponema sp.]|jgi:addiction module RelE/StbE family toxin|nr:type II toxin-antitoxin system RelE/ParE family toxin [Treponema sp.]
MPEIKYLPSFQQELNAIVDYITFTLEAPRAASNLLDELEKSINNLRVFPLAHRLYRPIKPIQTEYRVLTVKNYLVFYVVLEETIEIHRIIYKKRNLSQLIK